MNSINVDQLLSGLSFCVVDTETTGGKASTNRVIDVAVYRFHQGVIVEKFESLVNPGCPIPFWITSITGIHDDMVRFAPDFSAIAPQLKHILQQGVFVAHNVPFDFAFLSEEFKRLGDVLSLPQLCTLRLSRKLYADLPSKSLGAVCEHLLIDIWDRHRAAGDAEATVYVLKSLLHDLARRHQVYTWGDLNRFITTPAASKARVRALSSSPSKTPHNR
jgi:DNA polymerase III subunit epsilon